MVNLGVTPPKKLTLEVEGMLRIVREEADNLLGELEQTPDVHLWLDQKAVHQRWLLLRLQVYRMEQMFEHLTR